MPRRIKFVIVYPVMNVGRRGEESTEIHFWRVTGRIVFEGLGEMRS